LARVRAAAETDVAAGFRRLTQVLLAFGLLGLSVELVFLEHYEDGWMLIPLAVMAAAFVCLILVTSAASVRNLRMFRLVMWAMLASGLLGIVLHYRVGLEFQVDMDPTLSAGQLFWKVLHMKAPPALAPGAMAQLGLLGLISTYRHPAFRRDASMVSTGGPS